MAEIKQLDSKVVYRNKWMTVREDNILRPSGATGIYGVVQKPDFVVIAPMQDGYIHLVEQFRYPVNGRFWELPQGSWEERPGSDPKEVAAGELREETGLVAKRLEHIGYQYQGYGYSDQGYHIFLATDLQQGAGCPDAEEEDLVSQSFSIKEFEQMLRSGQIKDATTTCTYGVLKLKGFL